MQIEHFQEQHLEDAVNLFIEGYRTLRKTFPILPERYTQTEVILPLLQDMIAENPGIVCIEQGKIVGYLTGFQHIPYFKGIHMGIYIPEWGHAARPGSQRTRLYHEMYATLAREWIGTGCFTHAISYYATDTELQDLFYWNGFGLLVVDAIRSLDLIPCETVPHISIRQASEDDLDSLVRLKADLRRHLGNTPIFLYLQAGRQDREQFTATLKDEEKRIVVAEANGTVVAGIIGNINLMPGCQITSGPKTVAINFGYTMPDFRKHGVATLLLNEILTWAAEYNLESCSVDFESQNQEARQFWLKYFTPICFSSIRRVDERIAWAYA